MIGTLKRQFRSVFARVGIGEPAPAGPRIMDPGITDGMSEEEKFYRRTLWTVDWEWLAKQPKEPFVPPTQEEREEIERYLHLTPGEYSDEWIREFIDSGL